MNALVPLSGANALQPTNMDEAIRLAKAMSTAKMLPKHLWEDVGTCLMIVEQAMRWNMSPFAVAQCTSSINGKLMYEGKLLAAAAESVGAIEGHFDYEFAGEDEDRQVTISARRRGDTNPRQMTIKLKDVRTSNEQWKKQPDQMLVYSGARNWTRRFTPSVILGNYAPEEFGRDGKPTETADFAGTTLEHTDEPEPDARDTLNASIPMTKQIPLNRAAAAAGTKKPDRKVDTTVYEAEPKPERRSWAQWAETLELADRDTKDTAAIGRLIAKAEVVEIVRLAQQGEPSPAKGRIVAAVRNLEERYLADPPLPPEPETEDLPEVEIAGADKLAG